jgi:hypothetical protein
MRSKWREAVPSPHPAHTDIHPKHPARAENSLIERLAEERNQFVLERLKQAHKTSTTQAALLLLLIFAESILLTGLALTPDNIFGGASLMSLIIRLIYALGAGIASLLLLVSMAFALFGVIGIWRNSLTSSLPTGALTRQKMLSIAFADLDRLNQAQQRAYRHFHWAAIFFLIALLPYLLALTVLMLQII